MEQCLDVVFPIILYILLIILLVVLIIFVLRLIKTLGKVDRVVDDVSAKANKLNGVFNLIDNTADTLSVVSDKVVDFVATKITNFFHKRNRKKEDE